MSSSPGNGVVAVILPLMAGAAFVGGTVLLASMALADSRSAREELAVMREELLAARAEVAAVRAAAISSVAGLGPASGTFATESSMPAVKNAGPTRVHAASLNVALPPPPATQSALPVVSSSMAPPPSPSQRSPVRSTSIGSRRKPVRIYMDGVFDLMHYGHSNALRQAKAVGDVLVVGLVNDEEVVRNKGSAPVMPEQERFMALSGCKFVDEVIRNAPYDLTEAWVTSLVEEHAIDFIVHGDDPCITADGTDAYAYAKSIGKFKQIKRTEGVSTTDIVGRMLLMTKDHHVPTRTAVGDGASVGTSAIGCAASCGTSGGSGGGEGGTSSLSLTGAHLASSRLERTAVRSSSLGSLSSLPEAEAEALARAMHPDLARDGGSDDDDAVVATLAGGGGGAAGEGAAATTSSGGATMHSLAPVVPAGHSKFLPTARRIMQFADGKAPRAEDVVVYIAGSWDLFNAGHIAALSEARKFGTFLLVGIHDDATVNALRGHGLPVLNLYERTLSLLSCKHVDEVIIGAPWEVTEDLIKTMNIRVVVRGSMSDSLNAAGHEHLGWQFRGEQTRSHIARAYAVPEALGILRTFPSPTPLTALDIIDRILLSRAAFQKRYEKKSVMETNYYGNKDFIPEV